MLFADGKTVQNAIPTVPFPAGPQDRPGMASQDFSATAGETINDLNQTIPAVCK